MSSLKTTLFENYWSLRMKTKTNRQNIDLFYLDKYTYEKMDDYFVLDGRLSFHKIKHKICAK